MEDRRKQIIDAGLALLREDGLQGLTQPRVAARTGLRQSHLTYYYPTRADLLEAVVRAGMEAQLSAAKGLVAGISSAEQAAERIASATVRHEATRVLAALNQAADQDTGVRAAFNELNDGFISELGVLAAKLNLTPGQASIDLLHAVFVGLSIIDLATGRKNGKARAKAALDAAFSVLASQRSSGKKRSSRT